MFSYSGFSDIGISFVNIRIGWSDMIFSSIIFSLEVPMFFRWHTFSMVVRLDDILLPSPANIVDSHMSFGMMCGLDSWSGST